VKTIGVSIVDFMFGRANVTIDAGSTGQGFSFTFDHAGSYPYFCSIHPFMTATIAVEG
jgi:plastocyanin